MKHIHAIICVSLLCLNPLAAQADAKDQNIRETYAAIQKLVADASQTFTPGISLSVQLPGQPIKTFTSGMRQWQAPAEPVRSDDVFEHGSVTKTYTAAIILQLIDERKLTLDETLQAVVNSPTQTSAMQPLAEVIKKYPYLQPITLRQLLNHTSGIADELSNKAYWETWRNNRQHVWLDPELVKYGVSLPHKPSGGKMGHYSNTNFTLLGMVIAGVSGKSYSENVHERLFNPLYLRNTWYMPEDYIHNMQEINARMAHGYTLWTMALKPIYIDQLPACPVVTGFKKADYIDVTLASDPSWLGTEDGGMAGTTQDLVRWIQALQSHRVISAAALDEMLGGKDHAGLVKLKQKSGTDKFRMQLGLGIYYWTVLQGTAKGTILWGKSGDEAGYVTEMRYLPKQNIAFAYTMTTDPSSIRPDLWYNFELQLVNILVAAGRV